MVENKLKSKKEKVENKSEKKTIAKVASTKTEIAKPSRYAVGRRKRAVARVRMYPGNGEIIINEKPLDKFITSKAKMSEFMKPLIQAGVLETSKFTAKVIGGGTVAQIEAVRHGIARCIAQISEDMKKTMKQGGYLTRDPREKERKKVYHVRARKSPQYSKR